MSRVQGSGICRAYLSRINVQGLGIGRVQGARCRDVRGVGFCGEGL